MAQHDMNIANQGFPATRADLNNALQALVSNSSGTSAPSTTFANQWWYDTTNNKMYIRNEANNAWIEVFTLDQTNNEWQLTTGVVQAKDSDGLALKTDDGTTRLFIKDSDGNIGIGEISPDTRLHLHQSADNNGLTIGGFRSTNQIKLHLTGAANEGFVFQGDRNSGSFESIYNASDVIHQFYIQGSERVRIQSGGGISFNGDTASGNALDDYEENTYAPTFHNGINPITTNITYNRQSGYYTKIGNLVHFSAWMTYSNNTNSSSSALCITLPFTSHSAGTYRGGVTASFSGLDLYTTGLLDGWNRSHIGAGVSFMQVSFPFADSGAYNTGGILVSGLGSTGDMQVSGTYLSTT